MSRAQTVVVTCTNTCGSRILCYHEDRAAHIVVFYRPDSLRDTMSEPMVQPLAQLYANMYYGASVMYREGNKEGASALLLELVLNPVVQRYVRVEAWSLLSFCTSDMTLARNHLLEARNLLVNECQYITPNFARVHSLVQRTDRMIVQVEAQRVANERYAQHLAQTSQEHPQIEAARVEREEASAQGETIVERFTIIPSQAEIVHDCEILPSISHGRQCAKYVNRDDSHQYPQSNSYSCFCP